MNLKFMFEITYVKSSFKSLFNSINKLMFFIINIILLIVCDLFCEINEIVEKN